MGYTGAVGTMLMDEMAGICGRAEERFTGIRTDIGKLETELLILGAEGVLPSRQIESFLRVFKQFAHTLPSRQVVG